MHKDGKKNILWCTKDVDNLGNWPLASWPYMSAYLCFHFSPYKVC